jgi:hypothetical protein
MDGALIEKLITGGSIGGAVVLMLWWSLQKMIEMVSTRLSTMEGTVKTFAESVTKSLDKIGDQLGDVREELSCVKRASERTADRVDAIVMAQEHEPPSDVGSLNGSKRRAGSNHE